MPDFGPGASFVLRDPILAAVFDMDGLLLDTEPLWRAAESELLERHGDRFTAADAEATHGRSIDETVRVYAKRLGGLDVAVVRDELMAMMRAHYAAGPPLRAGAVDFVEALGRRMPLGVASNTDGDLVRLALAKTGILSAFGVVVSAADVGRGKPHPDVFLAACVGLDVAPATAVAFEDSPTGVQAAKAAGMPCIGVPDRHGVDLRGAGADLVARSLTELVGLAWLP